jgi:hypothetical protein
MGRSFLGRDAEGRVVDIEIEGLGHIIAESAPDEGPAGEHPDLATHTGLGLAATTHNHDGTYAPTHAHPYAADDHAHVLTDGDIPAVIARDTEVSAAITAHLGAATHGGEASHPDLATHETLGLVTDTDLTTHAATAHGTQAHAISGVSHTGSLDHSALGAVTANQHHNQAHAIDGADHTGSLTAADVGAATSGHNHDGTYATAAHSHPGGSEAFPVGSVFLSVVSTNPATLLGYGTWSAFGQGRMVLGWNTGDTDEATGGAATHVHAEHTGVPSHTHVVTVTDPEHAHVENSNNATTGGLRGWGAPDTSTNTSQATGYSTAAAATGITATTAAPAGAAAQTHDSVSNLPPYVIVRMWKRTA